MKFPPFKISSEIKDCWKLRLYIIYVYHLFCILYYYKKNWKGRTKSKSDDLNPWICVGLFDPRRLFLRCLGFFSSPDFRRKRSETTECMSSKQNFLNRGGDAQSRNFAFEVISFHLWPLLLQKTWKIPKTDLRRAKTSWNRSRCVEKNPAVGFKN